MPNLRDLYQQVIIDHSKNPRNFCVCDKANHIQEGHNPLCGDKITIYVNAGDNTIKDICFQGQGCAISMASASLMTEMVKGKTIAEVLQLINDFQKLVTSSVEQKSVAGEDIDHLEKRLGKLAVLSGVREFPIRVKCATLPWHTLKAALLDEKNIVTTE